MIEDRILDRVSYGFQMGPQFLVDIVTIRRTGHEYRNQVWDTFKWRGTAPYRGLSADDWAILMGAFVRCGGPAESFRFKNWFDRNVTGQTLGTAPSGSTAVQLIRDYDMFGGSSGRKTITKPVTGTVTVYQDTGSGPVAKAGTIDTTTGLFTPSTAWTEGADLTADFEYDIPMRFASDYLPFTEEEWNARSGDVELIEVFGE